MSLEKGKKVSILRNTLTKSDHSVQDSKNTRKEFKSKNVQIVKKMSFMLCSNKTSQVEFELLPLFQILSHLALF
jgi:hypothetical protein